MNPDLFEYVIAIVRRRKKNLGTKEMKFFGFDTKCFLVVVYKLCIF